MEIVVLGLEIPHSSRLVFSLKDRTMSSVVRLSRTERIKEGEETAVKMKAKEPHSVIVTTKSNQLVQLMMPSFPSQETSRLGSPATERHG